MSKSDSEFLDRLEATPRYNPSYRTLDSDRLFALARRGAAVQATPAFTEGHCEHKKAPGGCQLHNLHCGYPDCDRRPAGATSDE